MPLNFDILTYVLKYLSQEEALLVSLTCKAIHGIVVREVLSDVTLETPEAVSKFPDFVFANPSKRLPLLRKLTVDKNALDLMGDVMATQTSYECFDYRISRLFRGFADFLTQVLAQSRHLHTLSLPFSGLFFQHFPEFRLALIQYHDLIELSLEDIDDANTLRRVINNMNSRLHTLSLSIESLTAIDLPSSLLCMQAHRQLQSIVLENVSPTRFQSDDTMQWPAVHSLDIPSGLSLNPLVAAFPNLRTLRLRDSACKRETDVARSQWTKLDTLYGDCSDISEWSLQCPVRYLDLSKPICEENRANLVHVLERTQPMISSMTIAHDSGQELWDTLAQVQVRRLDLTISHDGLSSLTKSWIKNIPRTMRRLQAPCLCIRFKPYDSDDPKKGHCEEIEVAEGLNGLQDVLAKSLPHLRFLAITAGPSFRLGDNDECIDLPAERTWWRIRRYDGDLKESEAELIPQWKGEALYNRLRDMDYDSLLKLKADEIVLD